MRNHVINELTRMAQSNDRMMLLVADLGFNVVNQFSEAFPNRFFNVGIAEQNLTAVSAGLALEGNMVFTYSIGNFPTLRCIEQIRNLVCYHNANVKILAVGGGFAYGSLGMTHHATEDIAMMRSLPNMRVYVPADAIEAVACFKEICKHDGPCYLRMARGREKDIHDDSEQLDVTKIVSVRESGMDVVILTAGTVLSEAVKLSDMLIKIGIKSSVYSVPAIKPIDSINIKKIARKTRLLVTIEEHNIIGGLGSAIAEVISDEIGSAPLKRFGLQDVYTSQVGNQDYLREYYGLNAGTVFDYIVKYLKGTNV